MYSGAVVPLAMNFSLCRVNQEHLSELVSSEMLTLGGEKDRIVLFIIERTDAQGEGCPCDFEQILGPGTAQGTVLGLGRLFLEGGP